MHLLGIESPGLTSALALAAEVVARLEAAAGRSVG
jgi:L-2-hydroxyglutarate oxidase LhgO